MTLILDAAGLIAVERGDREILALVERERRSGRKAITHGGVIAQVWRGGNRRQVNLARFLRTTEVRPLDDLLGRRAGVLLGRARLADAVDAAVVALAVDGDEILTADTDDLRVLAEAADLHIELIPT